MPLPDYRLASIALRAIKVDAELSPLVRRKFSLLAQSGVPAIDGQIGIGLDDQSSTVLRIDYSATTNRMLRVAVNGFMESLGVVLQVMEKLDVDVLGSTNQGGK